MRDVFKRKDVRIFITVERLRKSTTSVRTSAALSEEESAMHQAPFQAVAPRQT